MLVGRYVCPQFFTKISNSNFSALGLDRDLGFLRGPQGRRFPSPHPDDDNNNKEEVDDDEDKEKNNNDDDNFSALGLDRDMGFLR